MATQAGYARLAARAQHPMLAELLHRIMKQEGRHIDMYAAEARKRLSASEANRRVTRLALRRFWSPVGTGRAARIDRHIDRLPGLAGLDLVKGAVAHAA